MTVFLSKRLLLLAQSAWWDVHTGQTSLVPRPTSGCHKAFVVSGTHVHFGCRGDQSPTGQQSKQWEPHTALSSLLGLISVAYPLIAWTAFPFILSIHHKITLVVSGKRQQLMNTVTPLMAEGSLLMGLG